jgi:hypothetical protein
MGFIFRRRALIISVPYSRWLLTRHFTATGSLYPHTLAYQKNKVRATVGGYYLLDLFN